MRTRPPHVDVLAPDSSAAAAGEAGRVRTRYGVWTVEESDGVLRERTPRLGLWADSSGRTVTEILAGWERARVV